MTGLTHHCNIVGILLNSQIPSGLNSAIPISLFLKRSLGHEAPNYNFGQNAARRDGGGGDRSIATCNNTAEHAMHACVLYGAANQPRPPQLVTYSHTTFAGNLLLHYGPYLIL